VSSFEIGFVLEMGVAFVQRAKAPLLLEEYFQVFSQLFSPQLFSAQQLVIMNSLLSLVCRRVVS
jgi:hypothetical protein